MMKSMKIITPDEKPKTTTISIFSHRFRYFILLLGVLCLTSISANMMSLNFTLICMKKPLTNDISLPMVNQSITENEYLYDPKEKSILMEAAAIGSMVAAFPFSFLYTKYGARYIFFCAGIISAISTFFIPFAVNLGFGWFVILRVLQGIAYAADFAAIGVLISRWASLKQNAIFLSTLTLFTPLSSAITNPISGMLCRSQFGWPMVYYTHGVVCLILFALWLIFYTDHPSTHKRVTEIELEKIHRSKTEAHINMDSYVPYKKICMNLVILTVWLNAFVDLVSGIFVLTYIPTYINSVLRFNIGHTGWLAALPPLLHIPVKLFCGYLSDKIKSVTETKKMMIFNSIALVGSGAIFILVGYLPDEYPIISVLLFTIINMCIGANCGGFYKCGALVSRQFSGFVIANIQFIKCISLFIAPLMVHIFVSDDSNKSEWRIIFIIFGIANFLVNILFCFMVTDKPAKFTQLTSKAAN